jgi:PleD family two-component response regulator
MQILIADDDPIVRAVVERVVQLANYDLLEAVNGRDALAIIEREDPDVLITDLQMPILDGFGLVEAVRASARHRALPIVCLSSVNDLDAITRLAEMGISDYVLKPIRPRDLSDRLRTAISKSAHWKASREVPIVTAAPAVLVVDPDQAFRSLVAGALAPNFTVVGAPTGAAAVTAFRARTSRITTVLISEGLQLLDEERLAALLRRLATDEDVAPPIVLLVSTSESVDQAKAGFDGAIRRSLVAEEFRATIAPWLGKSVELSTL